jgi:hypothetical protein
MKRKQRAPNRIYPVGFQMDREEFLFRCFMVGAKKIHERLSDKRVKLNIHNMYDWKKGKTYTGRGFIWFNVKMGEDYSMFWDDWESECDKLKFRYKITNGGSWKKVYTIRMEW